MSQNSKRFSRRRLLGSAVGAAAGAALAAKQSSAFGVPMFWVKSSSVSPNEQIGVGIIGCGRRMCQLQDGRGGQGKPPKERRIVAVADLNLKRAHLWGRTYNCPAYQDYRKLLERKDVEVVLYATPEHQHYLQCIHAAQAGKDIYGEQPLTHTIREGQVMIKAVRKHNVVFQVGEQQRSHPKTRKAVELILNGRIGKVHTVLGFNYPSPWECRFEGQPVPDFLDWDRWCGPNPVVPFNINIYLARVPYERRPFKLEPYEQNAIGPGWMSCRPYSGGELVNWGCHGLSMILWGLDMDESGPTEIWVEPAEKLGEFVYTQPEPRARGDKITSRTVINYRFPNGVLVKLAVPAELPPSSTVTLGNGEVVRLDELLDELGLLGKQKRLGGGGIFIGDKGKIAVFRNGYACSPKGIDEDPLPPNAKRVYASDNHMQNFFDCVRTRKDPIMKIEIAHRVATFCHLGNIARWLGRPVKWDPVKEQFPGDPEANSLLDIPRRKGYELPDVV